MTEEKKKDSGAISRREFLKDAGLVVGGAAIGSAVLLAACGGEEETVTNTVTSTKTVTTTAAGGTATVTNTVTETGGTATVTETVTEVNGEAAENVVTMTVNGKQHIIPVKPNETLHDVIHGKLRLIGAKTFCKRGACGSCTVIVDNRPILSCMTLAVECNGKTIETIEGIAAANHPLIQAYINHDCMQCGYCTPGFIVTAKALLDRNPNPTEDDVRDALAGNLCRCGSYPAHIPAVLEAAGNL